MAEIYLSIENYRKYEDKIVERLANSHFLVAITGAGISAGSGLPVLSGTVEGVSLKHFFEPALYYDSPEKYFKVYRSTLHKWRSAKPNAAHKTLAAAGAWVITQNIDGLHRDAGTEHLIELHGNLRELRCERCQLILSSDLASKEDVPKCPECGQILHPGITLEGEEVRHFNRALDWVGRAQQVFIIGTQLDMHPVRELADAFANQGVDAIIINEKAEEIIPAIFSVQ